jgi:histidyl-tRNA synthetase
MVRGLAYYTGVVIETFLVGKEQYGSIASGGRYGNLVGSFSSSLQDVEGVGLSIGVTRLFDILCKTGCVLPARTSCAEVLVGARTEALLPKAYALAALLRKGGAAVDLYSGPCKVKQMLGHASTLGIPYSALVMDESAVVVKQMGPQTQTEYTTLEAAVFAIQSLREEIPR